MEAEKYILLAIFGVVVSGGIVFLTLGTSGGGEPTEEEQATNIEGGTQEQLEKLFSQHSNITIESSEYNLTVLRGSEGEFTLTTELLQQGQITNFTLSATQLEEDIILKQTSGMLIGDKTRFDIVDEFWAIEKNIRTDYTRNGKFAITESQNTTTVQAQFYGQYAEDQAENFLEINPLIDISNVNVDQIDTYTIEYTVNTEVDEIVNITRFVGEQKANSKLITEITY